MNTTDDVQGSEGQVIPNLAGIAKSDDVSRKNAGKYQADYINWAKAMQILRDNAPDWLPMMIPNPDGGWIHKAGVGGYLMIGFRNMKTGVETPAAPQAIMDHKNEAIEYERISARDVTDSHRRGICMAAALQFGLAYELWAKMDLESGYADSQGSQGKPSSGRGNSYAGHSSSGLPIAAGTVSEKQIKAIHAIMNDMHYDEAKRDAVKNHFQVGSMNDLSMKQASDLIEHLKKRKAEQYEQAY